jgi:hypothetical protein
MRADGGAFRGCCRNGMPPRPAMPRRPGLEPPESRCDNGAVTHASAAEYALDQVGRVRDDPGARLVSLRRLYEGPEGDDGSRLPFERAARAFMAWQARRGLLWPEGAPLPGSPWWRAVNERLLRDGWEARGRATGRGGPASSSSVLPWGSFIRSPSARTWYRAHNASIVAACLEHRALAEVEGRTERFFINVTLLRVLYAHALVAAPRLALGWLAPLAPLMGDPRLGMTGIFLSISRVVPDRYPLGDDLETFIADEHTFGLVLDRGVIGPRLGALYAWSARELGQPALAGLLVGGTPAYAWPPDDDAAWWPPPTRLVRAAQKALPHRPERR